MVVSDPMRGVRSATRADVGLFGWAFVRNAANIPWSLAAVAGDTSLWWQALLFCFIVTAVLLFVTELVRVWFHSVCGVRRTMPLTGQA